MSTLCIVLGPPGSGKTWCSRQLGNALTLTIVSTDALRAELGIPASDRESESVMYAQFTDRVLEALNQGKGVVADATFYLRSYREVLRSRAMELDHEVLLIHIVTPLEFCRWRVAMRDRKREDGYGGITSTAAFDDLLRATQGVDEAEAALYAGGAEVDSSVDPMRVLRQWGPRAAVLFEQWQERKTTSRNDRGFTQLRRLFRGNQAPVAFVGSGLSTNYPSWFQFVLRVAKRTNHAAAGKLEAADRMGISADPSVAAIKDNIEALTAIADECLAIERNQRADYAPAELVSEVFRSSWKPRPSVFDSLVRAPFRFFITTNYDRNIEEAFAEVTGPELPVVTAQDPGRVIEYVHAGQPFVFKVHGCVRSGGPYVIGADDYTRIIREAPDVRMLLRSIFATHSIVFLGYGHRDPHITGYLQDVRTAMRGGGAAHATFVRDIPWVFDVPTHYARRFGVQTIPLKEWHDLEPIFDELSFLELSRQPGAVVRRLESSYERLITRGSGESLWGAVLYSQASLLIGRTEAAKQTWSVVNANQALQAAVNRTSLLHLTYCIVTGAALRRRGDSANAAMLLGMAVEIAAQNPTLSPVLRAHAFRHAGVFHLWPGRNYAANSELAVVFFKMARAVIFGGAEEGDIQTPADPSEEVFNIEKYIAIARSAKDPAGSMQSLLDIAREARDAGHLRTAAWCDFNALQAANQHNLSIFIADEPVQFSATVLAAFESLGIVEGIAEAHLLRAQVLHKLGRDKDAARHQLDLASAHALILGDDLLRQRCLAEMSFA